MEENNQLQSNQSSKGENLSVELIDDRVIRFLRNIYADENEKFQQSKLFRFPFFIDEIQLTKINELVIELLGKFGNSEEVKFSSTTTFSDISSLKLNSFIDFLKKAGDKKDPHSATIQWSKFHIDRKGIVESGEVIINYETEKKFVTQDLPIGEYNSATILLTVSGSTSEWVENSMNDLMPYIETSKQSGLFKPLWVFRNKTYIHIFSQLIGMMGFFIGINQSSRLFNRENIITREEILQKILQTENANEKIDIYATYILTPSSSPWWEPIVMMGTGFITYILLTFLGMTFLPKLTPNSYLAIGLNNYRAKKYENVFKFIIFSVIISGIIIPIIMKIFGL